MIRLEQPNWRSLPVRTVDTGRLESTNGVKIKNIVINCHGLPAFLQLGEGFSYSDVSMFSQWEDLCDAIWITGCLVSRPINKPHIDRQGGSHTGDGRGLCSRLAHYTNSDVIASDNVTVSWGQRTVYPYRYISTPEGHVNLFERGTGRPIAWTENRFSTQDSQGRWHGEAETR